MSSESLKQKMYDIPGLRAETFLKSYLNADLIGTVIVVEHHMDIWYPSVTVYNEIGAVVDPASLTITCPDSNKVLVDVGGPISGKWHVRVIGG